MSNVIIYKLPTLEAHQEWACEQGCTVHKPKHFKNVYARSWDLDGNVTAELSERYWTCQQNHILKVWDNNTNDYVKLSPEYTTEPEGE